MKTKKSTNRRDVPKTLTSDSDIDPFLAAAQSSNANAAATSWSSTVTDDDMGKTEVLWML
jgi:hypothetical protein